MYNLQKEDIIDGANLISKAFLDDPKIIYFLPNEGNRRGILHHLWTFILKDGLRNGKVFAPTSKLEGIAIWYPPNKVHIGVWRGLRNGVLKVVKKFGKTTIRKMNQINKISKQIHNKHISEPHWYLALIAVKSEYQGRGYASQLLIPMIKRIQNQGLSIYLETNSLKNVSLYEHFNFKVVEELKIQNTTIPHWSMIRYKEIYLG